MCSFTNEWKININADIHTLTYIHSTDIVDYSIALKNKGTFGLILTLIKLDGIFMSENTATRR